MIVTESKNRKIKICDQILEEIYSQIQKNDYDPEKGGIIVGRENLNNENIILEYISKPLKNDICTRTRYTRKDEGHLKYFEKLYNENNGVYAYWGEWHTHPEDIPHYSIIDLKNWKRIGKESLPVSKSLPLSYLPAILQFSETQMPTSFPPFPPEWNIRSHLPDAPYFFENKHESNLFSVS